MHEPLTAFDILIALAAIIFAAPFGLCLLAMLAGKGKNFNL